MEDLKTTLRIDAKDNTKGVFAKMQREAVGVEAATASINKQTDSLGKSLRNAAIAMTAFVAASAGISKAIGSARQFQKSMHEVATLLDDGTKNLKEYSATVDDLMRKFGGDYASQTKGLYDTISAGFGSVAASSKIMNAANVAAIAGVTDTAVAVDALTTVLNSYNKSADQVGNVSDIMFKTVKLGKTTFEELGRSIGLVAATGSAMNVTFEEVGAAIAAATAKGIRSSQAITGLKQAIANITKPTKDAADMAEQLGVNFSSAGLKAKGFKGFIVDVLDKAAAKGVSAGTAMEKFFGSVEALNFMFALTDGNAKKFLDNLVEMENAAGATSDAYKIMTQTFDYQWNALMGKLSVGFKNFGSIFTDALIGPLSSINKNWNIWTDNIILAFYKVYEAAAWLGSAVIAAFKPWQGAFSWIYREVIKPITTWFYDMYIAIVGNSYVPDLVNEVIQHFNRWKGAFDWIGNLTKKIADFFKDIILPVRTAFQSISDIEAIGGRLTLGEGFSIIGNTIGNALSKVSAFRDTLLNMLSIGVAAFFVKASAKIGGFIANIKASNIASFKAAQSHHKLLQAQDDYIKNTEKFSGEYGAVLDKLHSKGGKRSLFGEILFGKGGYEVAKAQMKDADNQLKNFTRSLRKETVIEVDSEGKAKQVTKYKQGWLHRQMFGTLTSEQLSSMVESYTDEANKHAKKLSEAFSGRGLLSRFSTVLGDAVSAGLENIKKGEGLFAGTEKKFLNTGKILREVGLGFAKFGRVAGFSLKETSANLSLFNRAMHRVGGSTFTSFLANIKAVANGSKSLKVALSDSKKSFVDFAAVIKARSIGLFSALKTDIMSTTLSLANLRKAFSTLNARAFPQLKASLKSVNWGAFITGAGLASSALLKVSKAASGTILKGFKALGSGISRIGAGGAMMAFMFGDAAVSGFKSTPAYNASVGLFDNLQNMTEGFLKGVPNFGLASLMMFGPVGMAVGLTGLIAKNGSMIKDMFGNLKQWVADQGGIEVLGDKFLVEARAAFESLKEIISGLPLGQWLSDAFSMAVSGVANLGSWLIDLPWGDWFMSAASAIGSGLASAIGAGLNAVGLTGVADWLGFNDSLADKAISATSKAADAAVNELKDKLDVGSLIVGSLGVAGAASVVSSTFRSAIMAPIFKGLGVLGLRLAAVGAGILSGPVGWLALGAVGAGVLLYSFWDDIKPMFENFWADMKSWWASLDFNSMWDGLIDSVKGLWDRVKGIFTEFAFNIGKKIAGIGVAVKNKFKETFADVKDYFGFGDSNTSASSGAYSIPGRATGGPISGPGTSTSDSILAMLSDGEFVINAASAKKYKGLIEAINKDSLPGFANGGSTLSSSAANDVGRIKLAFVQGSDITRLKELGYNVEAIKRAFLELYDNLDTSSIVSVAQSLEGLSHVNEEFVESLSGMEKAQLKDRIAELKNASRQAVQSLKNPTIALGEVPITAEKASEFTAKYQESIYNTLQPIEEATDKTKKLGESTEDLGDKSKKTGDKIKYAAAKLVTFADGWKRTWEDWQEQWMGPAEKGKRLAGGITNAIDRSIDAIVDGTDNIWKSLINIGNDLARDITKSYLKEMIAQFTSEMEIFGAKGVQNIFGGYSKSALGKEPKGTPTDPKYVKDVSKLPPTGAGGVLGETGGSKEDPATKTKSVLTEMWGKFKDMVSGLWDSLKGIFGGLWDTLSGIFSGFLSSFSSTMSFGGISSGSSGGLFGSLLDGITGMFSSNPLSGVPGMAGGSGWTSAANSLSVGFAGAFAEGGVPPLNKVSLVGEEGPELFVPKQTGRIIPNKEISTGQTINVTNHITVEAPNGNISQQSLSQLQTSLGVGIQRSLRRNR